MARFNAFLFLLACLACGGGRNGGAQIQMALKLGSDGALCAPGAQCLNVAATGTRFQSLKYLIHSIEICEDLEISGSAFGNRTGCLSLLEQPAAEWPSDIPGRIAAAKASTDGWVDLMSASSRATLATSIQLTSTDAREYKWGLISSAPVVKVTATATRAGTTNADPLYTHDGTVQNCSTNGQTYSCVVASQPLTQAPAEEAVIAANMSGWFKFQAPLTISAQDISEGAAFSLDLAFDPDGLLQGVTHPGASNFPPLADSASGAGTGGGGANTMSLAALAMAPIPHKSSSTVMKETYLGTVTTTNDSFDLRVEFFYLDDDPSKTIYSVNVAAIPNANTQSYIAGAPYAYYLTTNGDGSVTLEDYDHTPTYSNFQRVSTVGATTVANVNFGIGMVPGSTGIAPVTFTLKTVGALQ